MNPLAHQWRLVRIALQYFTRVPVGRIDGFRREWLTESARYFPLVGWLVGALSALVLLAAAQLWPPLVAAGIALAFSAWITGAFHEDGLADTFDALGGQVDRERALAIMKDSRIGSYGALALALVLALRWLALASLPLPLACAALFALHPAARAGAAALMAWLPYVRDDDSKAKPVAQALPARDLLVVLLLGIAPAAALALWRPAWLLPMASAVLAVGLVHLSCRRWYRRRLGGYTGDGLGACEQLGELAFLLAVLAAFGLSAGMATTPG
jgi:adenosylcobinamide-GDP ribazoletransferase